MTQFHDWQDTGPAGPAHMRLYTCSRCSHTVSSGRGAPVVNMIIYGGWTCDEVKNQRDLNTIMEVLES